MKTINYRFSARDFERIANKIDEAVNEAINKSPILDEHICIDFLFNQFTSKLCYRVWGVPFYQKVGNYDIHEWSFLHTNSHLKCPEKLDLRLGVKEWKYLSESFDECYWDGDYEIASIHLKLSVKKYYHRVIGFSIFGKGIQDGLYYRFDYGM
jgi:hypothetical protein